MQQIEGEVYECDSQMTKKLDEFEDHPDFYVRTEAEVLLAPEVDTVIDNTFDSVRITFDTNSTGKISDICGKL